MNGRKVFILVAAIIVGAILATVASLAGAKSVLGFLIAWALITALFFVGLWVGRAGEWDWPLVNVKARRYP